MTKQKNSTLEEQIAEAQSYEEKLGAKYVGRKKNGYDNYFGFAREGFEDRWTRLSNLRKGSNPFSVPTIGEQETKAKSYAKVLGAKYIGWKNETKGQGYQFGFAKKGCEDRWVRLVGLRNGSSPFTLSTIGEQEEEAKSYAKKFGARYMGYKRIIASNNKLSAKFGFAKEGFEDRWILMGGLRRGGDPFSYPTISEQENEAKSYEKKLGAKYLGWKSIKKHNYFGFAKKGFEDRWIIINTLRKGGNPFSYPTIGELENEAKSYEKKLEAKYIGWKMERNQTYFGFAKDGFEDRWTTLHNLRKGSSPFNALTIGEQEAEAKSYTEMLGATYLGWKNSGNYNCFGFAKEGFEDRWVHLSGLRKGCNPFTMPTINELEIKARAHAKKLGVKYIGWKNISGANYFGFAKGGYEDRWLNSSHLRKGYSKGSNPFLNGTIGEQEAEAKAHAVKLGAEYIGYKKGKSCNQFGFAKDGFEDRWVNLSQVRSGQNSFNNPTIGEMEAEAKTYEEKFGAKYIGWNGKKGCNSKFGFAKKGFEDRWTNLGNMRKGSSPFNLATDNEQEAEAKPYAKKLGAKYLGWKKGKGSHKLFGFAKKGYEDRWTYINNLREGHDPFQVLTTGEQEIEAKQHQKRLNATYIGWKQGKGKKMFGFAKEGLEDAWISLSHLRGGNNPFIDSGFDVNKVGYFYVLLVTVGAEQYIKFGITNNKQRRMVAHTQALKAIDGQWSELHIKRFKSGQKCFDFETKLKRHFKNKRVSLGVIGFKSECFHSSIKDALFEALALVSVKKK